jgi:6-pyruvoyltetrahydropterin/6-carboxytetrahydropterin synthase
MWTISKRIEIAGAHCLKLDYESKCNNLHGHNWVIWVHCKSDKLNENGMIIDFVEIKKVVSKLDHACLNDFVEQPTAENIAKYLCDNVPFCYKVEVQECEGNIAIYEKL